MKDKDQVKKEEKIIANTVVFVKKKLQNDFSGHDWWHIYRVWEMSLYMAIKENANSFIVQLSALLHDIDDWKLCEQKEPLNTNAVKDWLFSQEVEEKTAFQVCTIIEELSFKGAGVPTPMSSIEGAVVQDADRLDAIGAIGIARAFTYGGNRKRVMYNPEIKPLMHQSYEEYKTSQSTTINHFYEKLLLLKDTMNTDSAKKLAKKRHLFLEEYLEEFLAEWHGSK